jgi:hypothetical protein
LTPSITIKLLFVSSSSTGPPTGGIGTKTIAKIITGITKSSLDLTSRLALPASPDPEDFVTHIEEPDEINLARKKAYNEKRVLRSGLEAGFKLPFLMQVESPA